MNKYFASLTLLAHTMFFTHVSANPFEKMLPSIVKDAISWSNIVTSTLNNDMQLSFLNLFAFSFGDASHGAESFMKCAEYIEAQLEMKSAYELLSSNIIQQIKKYIDDVQAKIAQKKNLTKQDEAKLIQKLEAKIQELIAYINSIYYNILYGAVSKKTSSAPLYMFDENGIIPQDKRTKQLPQPASL